MLLLDHRRTLPTDHKWESILTVVVQVSCAVKSAVNNLEAQQSEPNDYNLLKSDWFHLLRQTFPEKVECKQINFIKNILDYTYILNWSSTKG